MKAVIRSLAAFLLVAFSLNTHAITIQVEANVDSSTGNAPLGMTLGEKVILLLTYDPNLVTSLSSGSPPGATLRLADDHFTFSITFPDGTSFTDADVSAAAEFSTLAQFSNFSFSDLDIAHQLTDLAGTLTTVLFVISNNSNTDEFEAISTINALDRAIASWDLSTIQPVPLPAALWFFLTALVGLGIGRNRT